ncbi:MAG TPA: metal-dependent hydrolase [Acidobacteriaceae bacterium]|nr:metal-dependent hydrolase [Acidobacteriaceae bacterium]
MEPVTHFLTGACLGRSGFNRTTAYATLAMTLAAEAPDLDVLWGLRGPVAALQHHRGITHTFLGAPFMALLVTGGVWLWHRWRTRSVQGHQQLAGRRNNPPVRWGWIWVLALIADMSHILLDWTNNYGVRPFFPFNPHWYAGSLMFIFEPVLFAALLGALLIPAILGLSDREIGIRRRPFRGRGWAISALCVGLVLGCWRWAEHQRALHLLAQQSYENENVLKISASPYPVDVFRWFGVVETADFYQTAILNTGTDSLSSRVPEDRYFKQPQSSAVRTAESSYLGRVFLDWSQFPFVSKSRTFGGVANAAQYVSVRFQDLRFAYDVLFLHGKADNPLGGTVLIAPNGKVEEMQMGDRLQK